MENLPDLLKSWLYHPLMGRLIAVIIGFFLVNLLLRFLHRRLESRIRSSDIRYRLHKAIKIFGYLLFTFLVIIVFGEYLRRWKVALGVAGAGVAVALQEVITSIAGWVAISFGGFFSIGDRVQLGGITGDVIDIGILRTTVMETGEWVQGDQYNGRIVRIANSFIFKEPVFNYSGDFPFVWDEITLPIRHGSDYRLAREVIRQAIDEAVGNYHEMAEQSWREMTRKFVIEHAPITPMIMMRITDNWLEFTARYVVDYKKRRTTKDAISMAILEAVEKSGGKIGIASTTVQLVDIPELRVSVKGLQGPKQ